MKKIQIKMSGDDATREYSQTINKSAALGREVKISPKSHAAINNPGFEVKFSVETVSVLVNIGMEHTADLVMTKEAWEAMNKGVRVSTETLREFKRRVL